MTLRESWWLSSHSARAYNKALRGAVGEEPSPRRSLLRSPTDVRISRTETFRGRRLPGDLEKDVAENRVKPAGEWNTYELTCKGRQVTLWINGAIANQWKGCGVPRGYLGLEAERGRVEFRNIKLKPP
jgi:hypothetical protein